jgi:hypothetical protein
MENQLVTQSAFSGQSAFENAQRMAKLLCSSPLVPKDYQGPANLGSAVIALEIAQRLNASPLMVMQNLYVIHGRPSWSSQFVISALNSCGRFSPLRFTMTGEGDTRACVAWAYDLSDKEKLHGPEVSISMSKKEGWYQKNGSKWQTMPDLMLRYRAAAFFGRLYAPEILMGMKATEEVIDVESEPVAEVKLNAPTPFKKTEPKPEEALVVETQEPEEVLLVRKIREHQAACGWADDELEALMRGKELWKHKTKMTLEEMGASLLRPVVEQFATLEGNN